MDPHVAELWDGLLERGIDTWPQRARLWQSHFGVDMSAFPQADPLDGFVDARNAIAHGLGTLTRKQLRKRSRHVGHLRHAGITLAGDDLVIDESDPKRCADVVKGFVTWLDAAA